MRFAALPVNIQLACCRVSRGPHRAWPL